MPAGDQLAALGIALGLGLIVGLQRESRASHLAGVRTFPLVTLLGAVGAAALAPATGGWILGAGLSASPPQPPCGNAARMREAGTPARHHHRGRGPPDVRAGGVRRGRRPHGGGGAAAPSRCSSTSRPSCNSASRRTWTPATCASIMQFVLLALVVLPVLPTRTSALYPCSTPREMWLMAVLIVGLSLAGYIALKSLRRARRHRRGRPPGRPSSPSTATTVSWSCLTRDRPDVSRGLRW